MGMWLYQINQKNWSPNRYRIDIWEGQPWTWGVGKIRGGDGPKAGDLIVLFYAPTGGTEAGFYGWAILLEGMDEQRNLYFKPTAPSDQLKMHPWWDREARTVADKIRGKVKQYTMFPVPPELASRIGLGIFRWVYGSR